MNVSRIIVRQFASKSGGEIHPGFFKLKEVQKAFQQKDGKPVFLKGGVFDQVLYRLTMGLSLVGIGGIAKLFWDLSVPKTEE